MISKAREFLKSICKCDDTCNINYKPYEYGSLVESIPFKNALEKFITDFEEMKNFFNQYGVDDPDDLKSFDATCSIWKKHLVVYR